MANKTDSFTFASAPGRRQTRIFYDNRSYSAFPHVVRLEGDADSTADALCALPGGVGVGTEADAAARAAFAERRHIRAQA